MNKGIKKISRTGPLSKIKLKFMLIATLMQIRLLIKMLVYTAASSWLRVQMVSPADL